MDTLSLSHDGSEIIIRTDEEMEFLNELRCLGLTFAKTEEVRRAIEHADGYEALAAVIAGPLAQEVARRSLPLRTRVPVPPSATPRTLAA